MKKITIKTVLENTNISATLVRSVVRSMGGIDSMNDTFQDVCNNGADGGYGNFVYYSDTVEFTRKNKKAILEMAEEQAQDFGISLGEMFTSFKCFKGYSESEIFRAIYDHRSNDRTTIFNGLSWYALEEVCREFERIAEDH